MTAKQLSDGNGDGTVMGQDSSDKISFFGGTPVAKTTAGGTVTVTAPVQGATAAYGFATTAQFNAVVEAVAALRAYGII